jgi:hypothetical protein
MKLPYIPKVPKLPVKRLIALGSWAFVLSTGVTGIFNFVSAERQQLAQPAIMQQATACEQKLAKNTPCTLDEQKAVLTREGIERQKWKGGVQAGGSILLIMAAF